MEEPGRLQSMGSLGVRHDWATSLSLFTFMHWRRKWQPAPVFLPGESQGQGSLVGCRLWGRRVGHDWSNLAAAASDKITSLCKSSSWLYWSWQNGWRDSVAGWPGEDHQLLCASVSSSLLRKWAPGGTGGGVLFCKGHGIVPSPVSAREVPLVLTDHQKRGASKSDPALRPGDMAMNKATWAQPLQGLRILALAALAECLFQVSGERFVAASLPVCI